VTAMGPLHFPAARITDANVAPRAGGAKGNQGESREPWAGRRAIKAEWRQGGKGELRSAECGMDGTESREPGAESREESNKRRMAAEGRRGRGAGGRKQVAVGSGQRELRAESRDPRGEQ
jgi:hypothetical protein